MNFNNYSKNTPIQKKKQYKLVDEIMLAYKLHVFDRFDVTNRTDYIFRHGLNNNQRMISECYEYIKLYRSGINDHWKTKNEIDRIINY